MEKILFLSHAEPGEALSKAALEALDAAKTLADTLSGATLNAGLFGEEVGTAAQEIKTCGAARILTVEGPEFALSRYASDAVAAEAICRQADATIIIAPGTSRCARVLPGVAHRIGGCADTHATGVQLEEDAPVITRWYYRQRMEAILRRTLRPWVILLDPGCGKAWEGNGSENGEAEVERLSVEVPEACQRTTVAGVEAPPADEQTIRPDAELLFVAGAGWTKKQRDGQTHLEDAERFIRSFLRLSRASLGSSKSLVDLSTEGQSVLAFMTHMNQVGQTGATPRHPKGLATCCHGEEPHVVGWRFISERRAVNLDPNCGWAQGKADVLYVADAFEVMAKVNELLEGRSE